MDHLVNPHYEALSNKSVPDNLLKISMSGPYFILLKRSCRLCPENIRRFLGQIGHHQHGTVIAAIPCQFAGGLLETVLLVSLFTTRNPLSFLGILAKDSFMELS